MYYNIYTARDKISFLNPPGDDWQNITGYTGVDKGVTVIIFTGFPVSTSIATMIIHGSTDYVPHKTIS